jgi:hypothetical protein
MTEANATNGVGVTHTASAYPAYGRSFTARPGTLRGE